METIDHQAWQAINQTYLAHALDWLRLRLRRLAQGDESLEAELSQAAGRMAETAEADPPPALIHLSRRFQLSPFEREVLLLCAAMELDTRLPGLCAQAQDDPHKPFPTYALAMALFDDPAWEALSPEGPLRYWRLVVPAPGNGPLIGRALEAEARIVNYAKGLNHLDESLAPFLLPMSSGEAGEPLAEEIPDSQRRSAQQIVRYLTAGLERTPVIQLIGPDEAGKQLVAQGAAASLGLHLYRLPAALLPAGAGELADFVRLWQRESALLPLGLYIEAQNAGEAPGTGEAASPLQSFAARQGGILFVGTRDSLPGMGAASVSIEVHKPTPAEQMAAWSRATGGAPHADQLAEQFNLNLPAIQAAARLAQATGESLWRICLAQARPRLDTLARRIQPKATWDDIVLSERGLSLLRQAAAQVRRRQQVYDDWGFRERMSRGFGITALFSGESGTGKTMAAEVLANELDLNLYLIDLSAVVSKYIGETEKNLRRVFDAAEDGGAILFFDEADALFGKRSDVKDSHDRYANIEINYLLQRMEAYRGLAILATNMKSALDQAFMRRLRFVIDFPFPTRQERLEIWRKVFPESAPLAQMDFEHLSRLTLTGSSIHNVALNAAFLAADAGAPVSMPLLLQAARTEFHKIGRAVNEAELNWQPANGAHA
jgi:hypothetical protein